MKATGDLQLLKRINRSVLLRLVGAQPGLSRARLAALSGLTKSTVSTLVRELIDECWLSEADVPVAAAGLGRPSTPLHVDAQRRVLIGVEIAVESLRAVCVTVSGALVCERTQALGDTRPQSVCRQVAALLGEVCAQLASRQSLLSGIGICLPGAVDDVSGVVRLAPNLGWRNVAVLPMLAAACQAAGVPATHIHLQNDADTAALSEYEFGGGNTTDPLIFINCDVGVGAGIVLNDRLFTGALGIAGEIGHTILQVDGALCSCGRRGCAETFVGSRALQKRGGKQRAGQYLGVMIQNLDAMFNPRVVVVGGRSCVENPELVIAARAALLGYCEAAGLPAPDVRAARYGLQAAAVGAAALVLHRYLRPLTTGAQIQTLNAPARTRSARKPTKEELHVSGH